MPETENPCPLKILSSCRPKECGVEFCTFREAYEVKKLANVEGGWAGYAKTIRERAQAKKEQSKTKKQRREESGE